jgi:hypothetical protein
MAASEDQDQPYEALPHQKSNYSLFNDPKLKDMFKNLPEADQKAYKQSGEFMYSYDYVNTEKPDEKIYESVAYIAEGLKSGLRPSQLDNSEITLVKSVYGDKWYERFGYKSDKD